MTVVLVIVAVIVVIGVIVALAAGPKLRRREDAAIESARTALGGRDAVVLIEPRATGMGTEPEEAGGLRGLGVLALSATDIVFFPWTGGEWQLARGEIAKVEIDQDDPTEAHKLTLHIHFRHPSEGDAVAHFRLPEPVPWLTELGYDWGPDGPPATDTDTDDDTDEG